MIRKTSIDAFRKIEADGLLSKRRFEVYTILYDHGALTAHEVVAYARKKYPLANQTGFNARLSELKEMDCIEIVGEKLNEISGTKNILWDVNGRLPKKIEIKAKQKCLMCGK